MNHHDEAERRDAPDAGPKGHLSRRGMLGLLALGGMGAILAGCENVSPSGTLVKALPDPTPDLPAPAAGSVLEKDTDDYAPPTSYRPALPGLPANPAYEKYDIIPRAAWAREGPDYHRIQPMNGVWYITFHHSGDPKPWYDDSYTGTARHLEDVREYHRSRHFEDIGYHFGIDRMGRVWQLRSLKYQGEHVRQHNPHNLGVVVLGNFQLQQMTAAQQARVKVFGRLLRRQYALPIKRVYTHQEIVATECPGRNMEPFMKMIRREQLI